MLSSSCWYIFLDAYTYSSSYLLFTLTLVIISILTVWICEKPQFYKLIYQRSKHSNIDTPVQSNEAFEISYNSDCDIMSKLSNTYVGIKTSELELATKSKINKSQLALNCNG